MLWMRYIGCVGVGGPKKARGEAKEAKIREGQRYLSLRKQIQIVMLFLRNVSIACVMSPYI